MTQRTLIYIILGFVVIIAALWVSGIEPTLTTQTSAMVTTPKVQQVVDVVNMTEEDFSNLREIRVTKLIADSAIANGLNPYIMCGMAYHESDKYKFALKKRKDSNDRYSYGLFQIQLETALLYDKNATGAKLLTPAYNTQLAMVIFKKNLAKYGSYEFAIAAHNAGTVYNNKITNVGFVKLVYSATGEITSKYYSLESIH